MTFVKRYINKNHHKLNYFRRHRERALGYQFPALATLIYVDSEIILLTDRSMVRRELYRLAAWITKVPT